MGSGGSAARKRAYAPEKKREEKKVEKKVSEKVSKALKAFERHSTNCKVSDLQKAHTIAQAFPLKTSTGLRNASTLPEKLSCANCKIVILSVDEDVEFYVCRSCWDVDLAQIAVCFECMEKERSRCGARAALPVPKSSASLDVPPIRTSQRSNRSLSSGSSEPSEEPPERRRSLPPAESRRSSAASGASAATEVLRRPPRPTSAARPSRQGSKQRMGSKASRQGSKDSDEEKLLPSGLWSATIQEGLRKTRCEERRLEFTAGGGVEGSIDGGSLKGFVRRPDVEWTETYPWGSMTVKLIYRRWQPWLLEGRFHASDGGKGSITLVHEELQAAVAMAT